MAQKSGGSGLAKNVKQLVIFVFICGLGLALLRAFDYDPFALIQWIWDWFVVVVTKIADFFTGNGTFQKATKAPTSLNIFSFFE